MNKAPIDINISVKIPVDRIRDLVISAWEGGSSYWCKSSDSWKDLFNKKTITVLDLEDNNKKHEIGMCDLETGLAVMANQFPSCFGDFISGNDDANTADVFWQCSVLGEVLYG